ncbi:MAG: TonB-dependent receptor [Gammaproteobacteria bacterium]|nr:TonB-dependent receptor [Gammaproteobacteria bacterium]
MNSALLRACATVLNGAALFLVAHPVLAADSADAGAAPEQSGLDEVVVTAQKRAQRAQDVPISLSVMSGSDLDSASITSVADALGQVPGVAINVTGQGGGTRLAVRGVTASGALFSGPSPIAYYLDSVPFGLVRSAVEPDANTYDLNRIEVLRGPQGTLYGASALNGVVRVITNDPDLNQFDFKGRAGLSTTESGGGNWREDMALNLPIVDGKLAARLVVGQEHDSGWINTPIKNNVNGDDLKNVRLKITAQPIDDLTIKLSGAHQEASYGAPPEATDDFSASTQKQSIATHYNAYDAKVDYEAPWFSLSSASSYLTYLNDGALDVAPGSGTPVLTTRLMSRVFSEEVNLNSRLQGPWRWSFGAFYRDARDSFYQTLGNLIPAPVDELDTSRSSAVYGELGRHFFDNQLELAVGARYFHDNVGMQQLILFGQPAGSPLLHQQATFNATTPRVVLSWFPNRDLTMYASYSEGFRSGYPQTELVQLEAPELAPVKPDKLHNYEIGGKGNLLDDRLVFDTAVYYMKWDGIQQNLGITIPGSTANIVANVNGQSASGMGVDLAITARPEKGLALGVNFSWNGLAEDSAVYSSGQLLFPAGARIDSSPAYTAGANAQYTFPIGSTGWSGELEASARYTSLQTTTSISKGSGSPPVVVESDTMTTGRVSFTVMTPSHWRVMFFCDNVGNNRGVPLAATTPYTDLSIRPRTTGFQVDYSYK